MTDEMLLLIINTCLTTITPILAAFILTIRHSECWGSVIDRDVGEVKNIYKSVKPNYGTNKKKEDDSTEDTDDPSM